MKILNSITKKVNNEKGVALLIAMMMLIMLTLIGVAAIMTSTTDVQIAGNMKNGTNSLYAAEAGIDEIKLRLNAGAGAGVAFANTDTYPWSATWGNYVTSATAAQLQNSSSPFYDDGYKASMVITSSIQSSVNWQWAKVTHKVERVSGNVRCLVTATGLEGDCSTSGVQNGYPVEQITALVNSQGTSKKILVELRPVVTPTQGGPVGLSNVDISGNAMVDSYASGSGVTPPTTKNTDPCNGTSGAVATNGSGNGVMSVQGNAKVCGTATVGVGGTGSSFKIQGSATVVGGTSIATSNVPSTIPTAPASDCTTYDKFSALTPLKDKANYIATPANGFNCFIFTGDVKLSDKTSAYFPAGSTVYFAKELEVEGTATMGSYTGPVGTPTISNLPTDLTFNGTSTAKEVEVESTGTLFANVIAPTASVKVSDNGKAYGGLLGATLKMEGNGHFYYDTNLSGAGSVARYVNYSWNQLE